MAAVDNAAVFEDLVFDFEEQLCAKATESGPMAKRALLDAHNAFVVACAANRHEFAQEICLHPSQRIPVCLPDAMPWAYMVTGVSLSLCKCGLKEKARHVVPGSELSMKRINYQIHPSFLAHFAQAIPILITARGSW